MSDRPKGNPEMQAVFQRAGEEVRQGIRRLTAQLSAGNSFARHRAGQHVEAAQAIAGLTQTERDELHAWARWLLGDEPQ